MKVDGRLMDSESPHDMNSSKSKSRSDLRKSMAWDNAFFTSPGVLDPEELFETLCIVDHVDANEHKEPERTRKSLAWDTAFFTGAGILNPDELSIVNRGYKRSGRNLLPDIKEGICMSTESNSTVTSDGSSLASLEIDLFEGMKSSLNKAGNGSMFGVPKSISKTRNGKASTVQDGTSRVNFVASNGDNPSLSYKELKGSSNVNHPPKIPNKTASIRTNHTVKSENKVTKAAGALSRKAGTRGSCSIIATLRSTKSPSASAALITNATKSVNFGVAPSNFSSRSPTSLFRSSMVGKKQELVKSSDSACSFSTPKSISHASPAKSLNGWSSESSTPTISRRSNNRNHPCTRIAFDGNASQVSDPGDQESRLFRTLQNINSPVSRSLPANVSKQLEASCLRVPSPKIGFFDVERSNGSLSGVQKLQSPIKCSPNVNDSGIRMRCSKHQTSKPGSKDSIRPYLKKNQHLKELKDFMMRGSERKLHRIDEDNK